VLESSVEIFGVEFDGSGVEVGFGSDGGMGSCGGGFGSGLHLAMGLGCWWFGARRGRWGVILAVECIEDKHMLESTIFLGGW
jgi:hypothetical protein